MTVSHRVSTIIKMSGVNVYSSCEDDDELHQLLKNVQLVEPDSDGGSDTSRLHGSQVPLFATVRFPTAEPLNGAGLPPDEGSHGERRNERGPCMPACRQPCFL